MFNMKWYAVFKGHNPSVYNSWPECSRQVTGYPGNLYEGYRDHDEVVRAYEKFIADEKSAKILEQGQ